MEVKNRKLSSITAYGKNAKKHDKTQINNVAESIKQYGFVQPIVIDREGVIVIGHCRAMAAKKLGMEEVPCVCVDDLTPEQVNAMVETVWKLAKEKIDALINSKLDETVKVKQLKNMEYMQQLF